MKNVIAIDHDPGSTAVQVTTPTPISMLDRALASGASTETLERLMALSERYEANQARRSFDEAIANAKAEIPPIQRNAKGHNDRMYLSFDQIARVVDPIITKHGLSYRFRTRQDDRIHVTCVLAHKGGHFEETTLAAPADTSGSKNAIQSIGSTLTYLQRYSLVQSLGLAATNDDDGHSAGPPVDGSFRDMVPDLDLVSYAQAMEIERLLEEVKGPLQIFLAWAGVEAVSQIPARKYKTVVARLQEKIDEAKKIKEQLK